MRSQATAYIRALTYRQARGLLAGTAIVIVGLLALVMYARRVETVEVVAVLLFLPVFAALLIWDTAGGAIAGVAAAGGYVALRWSAIHAVGFGHFQGLVASRAVGLVAFGLAGGLANRQLRASLTKLDLYDQVDDATGLFNARFLVQEIDLEIARSGRYKTVFSISVVDIPSDWFEQLTRRNRARVLRALGRVLSNGVRTVDRAVHGATREVHRVAVLLPETGPEGARIFTDRLSASLAEWLANQGLRGPGELRSEAASYPADEAAVGRLRSEFGAIAHAERALPPAALAPAAERRED
jgi:GGDEF domain-containing protein